MLKYQYLARVVLNFKEALQFWTKINKIEHNQIAFQAGETFYQDQ